ncbi:MAG: hypothetical protein COB59_07280 [Rhodospirillaceae bacterium]|nr:MAG: hypothetical protein COB59_07280 [Rhodospirillaceae bacterium]
MESQPLYILLCSEQHEKIQMAAMMAAVAAVSERKVYVFVSMGAIIPFGKTTDLADRYKGGVFSDLLIEKKAPDAIELFKQGKRLGDLTLNPCSMVMDILAWDDGDLIDDLFDEPLGLTKFLSDAETGQFITL